MPRRRSKAALVGAVAVGLLAAALTGSWLFRVWRPESAVHASLVTSPTIDGQRALVVGNPTRRRPQPLVLVLHGAGGTRRSMVGDRGLPFTQSLADQGYLVASSDAHGTVWGTQRSQQDYRRLYQWVAARYHVGPVVLVSVSMGGIPGLHLLAEHAIPRIAGWVGVSPVTDLEWAAHDERLSGSVAGALDETAVRHLDPMRIAAQRFRGVDMTIFAAPDDDVVPDEYARSFAEHVAPATRVRLRACTGGHVAASCYSPAAVERLIR